MKKIIIILLSCFLCYHGLCYVIKNISFKNPFVTEQVIVEEPEPSSEYYYDEDDDWSESDNDDRCTLKNISPDGYDYTEDSKSGYSSDNCEDPYYSESNEDYAGDDENYEEMLLSEINSIKLPLDYSHTKSIIGMKFFSKYNSCVIIYNIKDDDTAWSNKDIRCNKGIFIDMIPSRILENLQNLGSDVYIEIYNGNLKLGKGKLPIE